MATADKNGDRMIDFDEFEGFSDFGFAFLKWGVLEETAMAALRTLTVCDRKETCFPSANSDSKMLLR